MTFALMVAYVITFASKERMTCLFGLGLDCTHNPVRGIHVAWVGYCLNVSVKEIEEVSPQYTMQHWCQVAGFEEP